MTLLAQALTLDQLRSALARPNLDDAIRNVATMASVSLALLTLYTTRRGDVVAQAEKNIGAFTKKQLYGMAAINVLLALLTLTALVAMSPLLISALDGLAFARQAGALRTLFVVIYIAFAALWIYQGMLVVRTGGRIRKKK